MYANDVCDAGKTISMIDYSSNEKNKNSKYIVNYTVFPSHRAIWIHMYVCVGVVCTHDVHTLTYSE